MFKAAWMFVKNWVLLAKGQHSVTFSLKCRRNKVVPCVFHISTNLYTSESHTSTIYNCCSYCSSVEAVKLQKPVRICNFDSNSKYEVRYLLRQEFFILNRSKQHRGDKLHHQRNQCYIMDVQLLCSSLPPLGYYLTLAVLVCLAIGRRGDAAQQYYLSRYCSIYTNMWIGCANCIEYVSDN